MFAHCGDPVVSLHRNVVPDPVLFKVTSCYHGEILALTEVQFLWSWWMITLFVPDNLLLFFQYYSFSAV